MVGSLVQGMAAPYFPLPGASEGPLCPSVFQGTILLPWSGYKGNSCPGSWNCGGLGQHSLYGSPLGSLPHAPAAGHYRQLAVP